MRKRSAQRGLFEADHQFWEPARIRGQIRYRSYPEPRATRGRLRGMTEDKLQTAQILMGDE